MYVLDSCAFISGFEVQGQTATVPSVRDELEDSSQYRYDAMEGSGMRIQIPAEDTRETVRRAARDSGDLDELSETDLYLIAATLELDGTLVTDDYAMQNVASRLDVDVEIIAQDEIEEERDWKFQCQGCGRVFDEKKRCPVCGSETTRKNPNQV
ncbi:MAG: NOB1 family endonuclease [Halobacteria archaeon]|nr:NOB1 family endonuclease [Halobacteria archaeon]